jgi:hypothetical protein
MAKKPQITEYALKSASKIELSEYPKARNFSQTVTYEKRTTDKKWFRPTHGVATREFSTESFCDYLNTTMNYLDSNEGSYFIRAYKANSKQWFVIYNTLDGLKSKRFKIIES